MKRTTSLRAIPISLQTTALLVMFVCLMFTVSSCYDPGVRRAGFGAAGGAIAGGILGGGRGAAAGAIIGGTLGALSTPPPDYGYYAPPPPRYYGYDYGYQGY